MRLNRKFSAREKENLELLFKEHSLERFIKVRKKHTT